MALHFACFPLMRWQPCNACACLLLLLLHVPLRLLLFPCPHCLPSPSPRRSHPFPFLPLPSPPLPPHLPADLSRTLSYQGSEFQLCQVPLDLRFRAAYNEATTFWVSRVALVGSRWLHSPQLNAELCMVSCLPACTSSPVNPRWCSPFRSLRRCCGGCAAT